MLSLPGRHCSGQVAILAGEGKGGHRGVGKAAIRPCPVGLGHEGPRGRFSAARACIMPLPALRASKTTLPLERTVTTLAKPAASKLRRRSAMRAFIGLTPRRNATYLAIPLPARRPQGGRVLAALVGTTSRACRGLPVLCWHRPIVAIVGAGGLDLRGPWRSPQRSGASLLARVRSRAATGGARNVTSRTTGQMLPSSKV